MNNIILHPSIPYLGIIDGDKFTPQKLIRIQGIVPQNTFKLDITLQCSNTTPDDIAVKLSFRFLNKSICVISFRNGVWEEEVRKSTESIKHGDKFEIVILCTSYKYKVAINGQHYFDIPQKKFYDKISHLRINGDVSITQISYESAFGSIAPKSTDLNTLNVENRVPTTVTVSSPQKNEYMHEYPTSSLQIYELNDQSTYEKSHFPTQSVLQQNQITNDSHFIPKNNHLFRNICTLFCVTMVIIIIVFIIVITNLKILL